MSTTNSEAHLAVLIDGDNVSFKIVAGLMAAVANYGNASVRRIYGDWTSPTMKGWRECLLEHSITPIQQFAYTTGKNATDGAMIIDAMDLLYTGRFSKFCLVSSDSDFTRLAARIREQGIAVYGFGNRKNTHRAFVAACNEFIYFDVLPTRADEASEPTSPGSQMPPKSSSGSIGTPPNNPTNLRQAPPTGPKALINHPPLVFGSSSQHRVPVEPTQRSLDQAALDGLRKAIQSSDIYDEDFVNLANVGDYLTKISPDLNARNYGFPRLRDFAVASGIVQLKMKPKDNGPPIALVRLKG